MFVRSFILGSCLFVCAASTVSEAASCGVVVNQIKVDIQKYSTSIDNQNLPWMRLSWLLSTLKPIKPRFVSSDKRQYKWQCPQAEDNYLTVQTDGHDHVLSVDGESSSVAGAELFSVTFNQTVLAEKLAKEKAVKEKIAQDRAAKVKAAKEKAAQEKAEKEKVAQERAAKMKAAKEKAAKEKAAKEKAAQEKVVKEKVVNVKMTQEKVVQEKAVQEMAEQEKAMREKPAQEKPVTDKTIAPGSQIDVPKSVAFYLDNLKHCTPGVYPLIEKTAVIAGFVDGKCSVDISIGVGKVKAVQKCVFSPEVIKYVIDKKLAEFEVGDYASALKAGDHMLAQLYQECQ